MEGWRLRDGQHEATADSHGEGSRPIPASRVLFWGGACTILFGFGSLVAILLRTTRLDLPVIRIAEVFIAVGLLSIVAGLVLRAREAKSS